MAVPSVILVPTAPSDFAAFFDETAFKQAPRPPYAARR
jgi:hypothetical protein